MLGLRHFGQPAAGQQRIRGGLAVETHQIGRIQHLVSDDGVQNRLPLPGVKIERPRRADVGEKPPAQQFCRDRRHQIVNVGDAVFEADAKLVGLGRQTGGKRKFRHGLRSRWNEAVLPPAR